jgi:Glycosyltransferase like family
MISIVVCSVNELLFRNFSESVEATIGVAYEIIKIDNTKNEYNLCAAYNKGTSMCKYDYIIFAHEDLICKTNNWGSIIIEILQNKKIGLAGVLGSCYISLFPIGKQLLDECEGQIITGAIEGTRLSYHKRFNKEKSVAEVAGADGIFLATRRDVLAYVRFDENLLTGFHGYDVDLNMQIRDKGYKIVVTRDILFFHLSGGNLNEDYFKSTSLLANKWEKQLPVYISAYSQQEINTVFMNLVSLSFKNAKNLKQKLYAIKYAFDRGIMLKFLFGNYGSF